MNKIYVSPTTTVVKVNVRSSLMNLSVNSAEISSSNGGLVKEDNVSSSSSRYNVWDDDWSD